MNSEGNRNRFMQMRKPFHTFTTHLIKKKSCFYLTNMLTADH